MATQLGELLTNTKGGKSVPLRGEGSGPPVWQSAEVQKIIWQPAAFNDPEAKRVPVCLEPEETAVAQLQEIERQVVELRPCATPRSSARAWRPTKWRPACSPA